MCMQYDSEWEERKRYQITIIKEMEPGIKIHSFKNILKAKFQNKFWFRKVE